MHFEICKKNDEKKKNKLLPRRISMVSARKEH